MPVKLEAITQPSEQDCIDLGKVIQDYPAELAHPLKGLSDTELTHHLSKLSSESTTLYGARFNDRFLGVVFCTAKDTTATLDFLCVREITRRRRVASQLINALVNELKGKGLSKLVAELDANACEGAAGLFDGLGFKQDTATPASVSGEKPLRLMLNL